MTRKPVAIVLGGTAPHRALIENLKGRGYQTLLVDYYEHPPAKDVADAHIQESTLDQEKVLHIAIERQAELVISGCVDQANRTACYVAEQLGLPAPYSYETALRVTDKALMKEGMGHACVPTADYHLVQASEAESFRSNTFPLVVKPCDSNGSKGVRKVTDRDQLHRALVDACEISRTGAAIVETFNEGMEINGYYFVSEGQAKELLITEKYKPLADAQRSLQAFWSWAPGDISELAREDLKKAAESIAREFRFDNTPLLMQANVSGDHIRVIEFAPRVGGGLCYRSIALTSGFDIIDAVVNSYLGFPVDTSAIRVPTDMVSIVHLYGTGGFFARVEGMESLMAEGIVEEFHYHKTPGMPLGGDLASRNRVLGVILRGKSIAELHRKTWHMVDRLRVISTDGVDVLDRSVFNPAFFVM